jgi:ATP-dependent Clp protease, protease subunit
MNVYIKFMKKNLDLFLKSRGISSLKQHYHLKKTARGVINSPDGNLASVDIYSKLLDERIIFLSVDEIDLDFSNMIKAQLLYLDSESDEDISMYIDSCGGSVYSGLGLLDVMEYIKCDVSTVNTGLAASMAAVILCSGAIGKRKALKRSRTMIHQPMGGMFGWSQASDIEIESREINSLKKELYGIISEKTGQPYEKVYKDGDRDYWMSSSDAKKYGMIDKVILKK